LSDSNTTRVENRARTAAHHRAFASTIESYLAIRFRHPVQCVNLDETQPRSKGLNNTAIDFRIDTEHAIEFALRNTPELHETVLGIINDEPVDAKLAAEVMDKCGKIFAARGLEPYRYFASPIRRSSAERRAA
jgi:hypothetical protein